MRVTSERASAAAVAALLIATVALIWAPAPTLAAVEAAPAPTPARTGTPASIAVLGDSISAATGTGQLSAEQKQNSWVTGSVAWSMRGQLAIPNGSAFNQSANGEVMADMDAQAATLPTNTQYVVVELGGNDLCRPSVGAMTSTTDYRNRFRAGLAALEARVPDALIFVASIPDIYNLWFIRGAPTSVNPYVSDQKHQEGRARLFWDNFLDIEVPCQSLLTNPESTAPADTARRQQVRDRNIAFNQILADECGAVLRCRFDGNAFFNFSSNRQSPPNGPLLPRNLWGFEDQDISYNRQTGPIDFSGACPVNFTYDGCGDHFHPSLIGQQKLANAGHRTSYQWGTDSTAPTVTLTPTRAPDGAGKYASEVSIGAAATDASGIRGYEVRVHHPDATIGPWVGSVGAAPPVTINTPGQSYVEARAFDNNGNLSAGTILGVNLDPAAFGRLSGVVGDPLGDPLGGITVSRHAAGAEGALQTVTTGADGRYDFGHVLTGSYKLRFTDPAGSYLEEWHDDRATHASADPVTVGSQEDVVIDATVAPPAPLRLPDAQVAASAVGPFKGVGVSSSTVTPAQTKSAGVARGASHTFVVKAQNNGDGVDSFSVTGRGSGSAGYTVSYFRGQTNITSEVRAGTYVITDVAPGASVRIKVRITATSAATAGSARNADITIRSTALPTAQDIVRARAIRT